jgi:uroporphyrinogen decarboxylase
LKLVANSKVDAFSFDHSVDLEYANTTLLNKKITMIGNINPIDLLEGKPIDIRRMCKEAIAKAGSTGFILAAGCDIPNGTPLENLQAMLKTE